MDANDTALLRSYNNTGTTTHDIDGDTSQMTVFMTGFLQLKMLINCHWA